MLETIILAEHIKPGFKVDFDPEWPGKHRIAKTRPGNLIRKRLSKGKPGAD